MTTPKHTPTPWEHGTPQWLATKWIDTGAHPLFLSDLKEVTNNAHQSLVAALRDALPALKVHAGMVRRSRGHHSADSAIADKKLHAARAALKLAGED